VNRLHDWLCRSAQWRKTIQQRVPWVVSGADLGHNVLELGPGPGLTTDLYLRAEISTDNSRVYFNDDGAVLAIDTSTGVVFQQFSQVGCCYGNYDLALSQNQTPIVVPCHRVMAAGGKTGGFSAPGGVKTKLKLLSIEGAQLEQEPMLFDRLPLATAGRRQA